MGERFSIAQRGAPRQKKQLSSRGVPTSVLRVSNRGSRMGRAGGASGVHGPDDKSTSSQGGGGGGGGAQVGGGGGGGGWGGGWGGGGGGGGGSELPAATFHETVFAVKVRSSFLNFPKKYKNAARERNWSSLRDLGSGPDAKGGSGVSVSSFNQIRKRRASRGGADQRTKKGVKFKSYGRISA